MSLFLSALLFFCILWALLGPIASPWIEKRLEWFMLAMGLSAVSISGAWSEAVVAETLTRPMKVCGAVLVGSLVFSFSHDSLRKIIRRMMDRVGPQAAIGGTVIFLGFAAGLVTKAIAVLTLVEILHSMRLERNSQTHVTVLGAFAIGLGGGLTPIGGPVPAIVMAKLAGSSFSEMIDAFYLIQLIGAWAIPVVIALGTIAGVFYAKPDPARDKPIHEDSLSLWHILVLTTRMYVFIAGLILLGVGIIPLVDRFLLDAPLWLLYWFNGLSAVVDGATLASIEISPKMSQAQLSYILIATLIAGGGLITGSAHNLVAAHKLKISSREWARIGLPTAAILMTFCFLSLITSKF